MPSHAMPSHPPENPVDPVASNAVVDRIQRHAVNTAASVVMVFLLEIASRWEMQPDTLQTHMAFPSKMVRIARVRTGVL